MLTIDQVKKILDDPAMSDEEAREIRDQLQSLAEIIFEQWQKQREKERTRHSAP